MTKDYLWRFRPEVETAQVRVGYTPCDGCGYESGDDGEENGLVVLEIDDTRGIIAQCNYCDHFQVVPPTGSKE